MIPCKISAPRALVLLVSMASLACKSGAPAEKNGAQPSPSGAGATTASATGPLAAGPATGTAATTTATAKSAKAPQPEGRVLSAADKKILRSSLAEGRSLGKAGKWNEAVATFSKVPEGARDGVLLSELCYAAYKDGNYPVAESACSDARSLVHAPILRAQVLFNSGLVEEASGAWAEAVRYHKESLALRTNATVSKHLADAQAKAAAKAPKENCDRSFASLDEACACLVKRRTDYLSPLALYDGAKGFCAAEKSPMSTGARALRLAPRDADEGNDMKFLFLADGASWKKMPLEVGDYEPGAFGVHNQGKIERFEAKTVNGHAWLLVHSAVSNNDYNLGGLELYASIMAQVTPCQLTPKPRCGATIALKNEDSLSYDDHGGDLSPEERKEFDEMKKNEYKHAYETELVLGEDGESYTVTLKSGDKSKLPPDLLGKHKM